MKERYSNAEDHPGILQYAKQHKKKEREKRRSEQSGDSAQKGERGR